MVKLKKHSITDEGESQNVKKVEMFSLLSTSTFHNSIGKESEIVMDSMYSISPDAGSTLYV